MKKPSRKILVSVVLLVSVIFLSIVGSCLWFVVIEPLRARNEQIALTTSFLEAYSEGDCARAKAFMDPAQPLAKFHRSRNTNPETFCKDYRIQIVKLGRVPSLDPYNLGLVELFALLFVSHPSHGSVSYSGVFEMTDFGVGPYPCPAIRVIVSKLDNQWVVTDWMGEWGTDIQGFWCDDLPTMQDGYSAWPLCNKAPGFSLALRRIDDTTIALVAEGVDPEGIIYIFYRTTKVILKKGYSGVVPIYPVKEKWVAFVNGETKEIDPWATGHFVYTLGNLTPLPSDLMWEVGLVNNRKMACAQIEMP